jgi:hypothetical protein
MATPGRVAIKTQKQIKAIMDLVIELKAEIIELKSEIAELKPKKRGRKPFPSSTQE